MKRGTHLWLGGNGMMQRVACGNRNARIADRYDGFIADPERCVRCSNSKHAKFFAKRVTKAAA